MRNIEHINGTGKNTIADDKRLSMKARGLWFIIWNYSTSRNGDFEIARFKNEVIGDGSHATKTAFEELARFGYFSEIEKKNGVAFYQLRDRGEA